ncbi:RNase H family protein [Arcobacter roscoffensis]|uniref:Ribonuclease H n=1 Tax=Arcobacter roscoffensis TaxID=2961520 RepID=A0ABY5E069_9BACT|nr:RNase H family protein [Arcobacter roscoffensis]UTJ05609.1 ribonuclease H [Arcobacter roscoffensis]
MKLFCDGSVNPQMKIGFGAYFILDENIQNQNIKTKKFENTSSTKLELEVLLWALKDMNIEEKIQVYTDCQNILSLLNRREKLEKNNFRTSTNKIVKNELLYKEFYFLLDKYEIEFIKVKGHKKSSLKDEIDKAFNLVDKASRNTLREFIKGENE